MTDSVFTFEEVPLQRGLRWFVRRGAKPHLMRGFKSKAEASTWIEGLGRRLDWRAGFVFRLRGDCVDMEIVNRVGEIAKI
jgi:hypothetical protein